MTEKARKNNVSSHAPALRGHSGRIAYASVPRNSAETVWFNHGDCKPLISFIAGLFSAKFSACFVGVFRKKIILVHNCPQQMHAASKSLKSKGGDGGKCYSNAMAMLEQHARTINSELQKPNEIRASLQRTFNDRSTDAQRRPGRLVAFCNRFLFQGRNDHRLAGKTQEKRTGNAGGVTKRNTLRHVTSRDVGGLAI